MIAAPRIADRGNIPYLCSYLVATLSPSQPVIRSAICRLFLSIISMWLLPVWPTSGSSRNLAEPPTALIAFTVEEQPSRRKSPFGPGAPLLLSPQTDSSGTLEKIFATSSGVTGAQLPSTLMKPSILTARARTRLRPYAPDCECTITIAGPILSSSAPSACTVLAPAPGSVASALGTSWAVYWSNASTGNCEPGKGVG